MTSFEQLLQEEEQSARMFLSAPNIQDRVLGKHTLERILRLKEAYNQQFPNSFEDWAETHYEIVAEMEYLFENNKDDLDAIPQRLLDVNEKEGSGGLKRFAIDLTDCFEAQNKGVIWGSEKDLNWIDAINKYLKTYL